MASLFESTDRAVIAEQLRQAAIAAYGAERAAQIAGEIDQTADAIQRVVSGPLDFGDHLPNGSI